MTIGEKRRLKEAARKAGAGLSTWLRLLGLKAAEESSEA